MTTSNCPSMGSLDSLRRDAPVPFARNGNGLALRIAVAALAGLALAVLASLPAGDGTSLTHDARITAPGSAPAPATEFDGRGKWSGYAR
ncbi:MAG: hypothetical protein ACFCUW_06975 [Kiloniellaceae bacterium]